jgi:hypothetical protein
MNKNTHRLQRLATRLAQRYPRVLDDMEARMAALQARAATGDEDARARQARVEELFALARERRDAPRVKHGVRLPS